MVAEVFPLGYFPNGIWHYALGGLFIGLGVALIYLLTGKKSGMSSFFSSVFSFFSERAYFQQPYYKDSRVWRIFLAAGVILGAVIFTVFINAGQTFITEVSSWRLLIGGILVGFGVRMSWGCTSGHGICGVSALNKASIIATITFLIIGILTAVIIRSLGVLP